MKDRAELIRSIIIITLVFILGMMVGQRYNSKLRWLSNSVSSVPKVGQIFNVSQPKEVKDVDFSTFWEVWGLLQQDYVEPEKLDPEKMVNGAISGMASSLEDPYTMYLPPVDNQRSGEDLAGAFYGVGMELGYVEGILAVVSPLNGTPAEKAGIKPGDLILHVKDEAKGLDSDTTGWSLNEAVNNIRGEKDTEVTLTLARKDDSEHTEPFDVNVKRGEIIVPSVELSFVEHNGKRVAHLKLSRFGERTDGEWNEAVTKILAEKNSIKGVVLDMRNNPGGFFDGAINIASEFIESGVVVTQKGRFSNQDYDARGNARLSQVPVEVLVNKGSASASEIVAGALRDRKSAKLIGEKTFGKGTVQDRRELSNGGGVHITIGQWLLPKGEWIHKEGIPVNIEVKDNTDTQEDEALLKAIEEI